MDYMSAEGKIDSAIGRWIPDSDLIIWMKVSEIEQLHVIIITRFTEHLMKKEHTETKATE